MSSRLVALSAFAALILGGCAHDVSGVGETGLFDKLFARSEPVPEAVVHEAAAAPVQVATAQSWGDPGPMPIGHPGPKAVASTDGPYLLDTGDRLASSSTASRTCRASISSTTTAASPSR